ncbi:MAG: CPBP family intramembrane metalloprotease [Vicingus serpentipes]|nr:CPBP family intramembrane metalloprotease [Vicingus serpentipes]
MASRAEIANKPFLQLLLIISLCLGSVILFSIVGIVLTIVFYGIDLHSFYDYNDPNMIAGLKFFQLLSTIGLFLVPPIVYSFIVSKHPIQQLSLKRITTPINYLLLVLLMFVSTPFMSWLIELNSNLALPEFLNGLELWMKQSEENAAALTKAFLTFDGLGSLFYVLLIVAVVPAIGEELLFRGVLQKIFVQWTKNIHWGIWITAILFSALHMQFYGFFPRMLLGLIFGYLLVWSKSLWLPILGHFINNGSVVVLSYLYPEMMKDAEVAVFGDDEHKVFYYILSGLLSVGLFYLIKKVNTEIHLSHEINNKIEVK